MSQLTERIRARWNAVWEKNGSFHIFFKVLKTQRVCFVLPFYSNSIFFNNDNLITSYVWSKYQHPKKIILVFTKDGIYISTFTFYCYLLEKKERKK